MNGDLNDEGTEAPIPVIHLQGSAASRRHGRDRFLYRHSIRSPSDWGNLRLGDETCLLAHETTTSRKLAIQMEGLKSLVNLARDDACPMELRAAFTSINAVGLSNLQADPQVIYTHPTIYTQGESHPHSHRITRDAIVIPACSDDITVFNSALRPRQSGSRQTDLDNYLRSGLPLRTWIDRVSTPSAGLNEYGEVTRGPADSQYTAEVVIASHWIDPVYFYPHGLIPSSMKAVGNA